MQSLRMRDLLVKVPWNRWLYGPKGARFCLTRYWSWSSLLLGSQLVVITILKVSESHACVSFARSAICKIP